MTGHRIAPTALRAYDIRGVVGTELTPEAAHLIGAAYATLLRRDYDSDQIVLANDNRPSSPELRAAFVEGLLAGGVDVHDIGIMPTGALYRATLALDVDGGVAITASHNPPEYNGFKFCRGPDAMAGDELQELWSVFEAGEFREGKGEHIEIDDFLAVDDQGRGVINVLAADKLMRGPKLYATFLLWLLAELFETLPEVGDPEKPKLVFFFDEAHLLFDDAPEALEDTVEQVVRLIRSKGVGVFFVTQNPIDIPEKIAGQLGNRVQHALRAFTPRDQRAIKAAAETFRINPDLDVAEAITELKVGEALVSTLDEDGAPTVVQRTLIKPPQSRLGPVTEKERKIVNSVSELDGKYDTAVDRESAEEVLAAKAADAAETAAEVEEKGEKEVRKRRRKTTSLWERAGKAAAGAAASSAASIIAAKVMGRKSRANPVRTAATSAAGTIASEFGGSIAGRFVRNLVGGLMR